MGAAMAPAAVDTLLRYLEATGQDVTHWDKVVTGDLGFEGGELFCSLVERHNVTVRDRYADCGQLIYDRKAQDVHAGGSGCGCSAAVFCSLIMRGFSEGKWAKVLFAPTGALMSPTSTQQGSSIPGICHALAIEKYLPD